MSKTQDGDIPNLAQYQIKLHFTEKIYVYFTDTVAKEIDIELNLEQIFKFISVRISGAMDDKQFVKELSEYKSGYYVDKQQALIVKNQLIALGLLEEYEKDDQSKVKLSALGKKTMNHLNAPTVG